MVSGLFKIKLSVSHSHSMAFLPLSTKPTYYCYHQSLFYMQTLAGKGPRTAPWSPPIISQQSKDFQFSKGRGDGLRGSSFLGRRHTVNSGKVETRAQHCVSPITREEKALSQRTLHPSYSCINCSLFPDPYLSLPTIPLGPWGPLLSHPPIFQDQAQAHHSPGCTHTCTAHWCPACNFLACHTVHLFHFSAHHLNLTLLKTACNYFVSLSQRCFWWPSGSQSS